MVAENMDIGKASNVQLFGSKHGHFGGVGVNNGSVPSVLWSKFQISRTPSYEIFVLCNLDSVDFHLTLADTLWGIYRKVAHRL